MAELLSDRYLLSTPLGEGGFSSVYKATDTLLDREVAIKILKSDLSNQDGMIERFLREAKLTASLKHTHSLQIFDYGHNEDQLYIVSELLNGQTLDQILEDQGSFSEAWICEYFVPLCLALQEAHEAGIIHRDLKPSNLFLHSWGQDTRLIIIDFGISKVDTNETSKVTKTGQLFGTPHYMSPEQIQRPDQLEASSDLYSLGIILFELISGSPPFNGETIYELLSHHIRKEAPLLSDLASHCSLALANLVKELLHKAPTERPQSALEVAQRLKALQKSQIPSTELFHVDPTHASHHTSTLSSAIPSNTYPTLDHVNSHVSQQLSFSKSSVLASLLITVTLIFTVIFLYFRSDPPASKQKSTASSKQTISGSVSSKSELDYSRTDQNLKLKTEESNPKRTQSTLEQAVEIKSNNTPKNPPKEKPLLGANKSQVTSTARSKVGKVNRTDKATVKKTYKKRRVRPKRRVKRYKKIKVRKKRQRTKPSSQVKNSVNIEGSSFPSTKSPQTKITASSSSPNPDSKKNTSQADPAKLTKAKSTKQSPNPKPQTPSKTKTKLSTKKNKRSSLNSSSPQKALTTIAPSESAKQSNVEKNKKDPEVNPPKQVPRPPVGF